MTLDAGVRERLQHEVDTQGSWSLTISVDRADLRVLLDYATGLAVICTPELKALMEAAKRYEPICDQVLGREATKARQEVLAGAINLARAHQEDKG